jgi:hypothetical protein
LIQACVYITVGKPIFALHYLGRAVSGGIGDTSGKPPLPTNLHAKTHYLLAQTVFTLCRSSSSSIPEIAPREKARLQDFISLTLPNSSLDLNNLSVDMAIKFISSVVERISYIQSSLSTPLIAPFSRIYHHIEGEPFNPDAFPYRLDTIKSDNFSLTLSQSRLFWINHDFKSSMEIACSILAKITGSSNTISLPTTLLLQASIHFEAQTTLSPSVIQGIYTYQHYALVSDMIAYSLVNNLKGQQDLRIPDENLIKIRKGMLEVSKILIQTSMSVCDECLVDLIDGEGRDVAHCEHGFIPSTDY